MELTAICLRAAMDTRINVAAFRAGLPGRAPFPVANLTPRQDNLGTRRRVQAVGRGTLGPVLIYKILLPAEWAEFEAAGRFDGSAFDHESGFIHCSSREQVGPTALLVFPAEPALVIAAIDADALGRASAGRRPATAAACFRTCTGRSRATPSPPSTRSPARPRSTRPCPAPVDARATAAVVGPRGRGLACAKREIGTAPRIGVPAAR
ncbi:hypothetical protein Pflav_055340 [Phytohabitans flavus]|uniref:DUF952 domain-containing protein n=1 Tax=Phytohabitans flavus TaxID=1076124 RepID=A0A6F8XZ47_9ACTN|nr:hypothetical protein Pflav_055340 [Phytohabitans flavus]